MVKRRCSGLMNPLSLTAMIYGRFDVRYTPSSNGIPRCEYKPPAVGVPCLFLFTAMRRSGRNVVSNVGGFFPAAALILGSFCANVEARWRFNLLQTCYGAFHLASFIGTEVSPAEGRVVYASAPGNGGPSICLIRNLDHNELTTLPAGVFENLGSGTSLQYL